MESYLTAAQACEMLHIVNATLSNWERAGKIRVLRTPGGRRMIAISEIERMFAEEGVKRKPVRKK